MAAQGTPQNYLYDRRPSIDTHRDRSMEQHYTSSGNPYGYTPSYGPQYAGYTPPMVAGGKWGAQPFAPRSNQFTLPGATNGFTPGYVPPPGASQYMPNFQSFQDAYQAAQQNQPGQGVAPNTANYQPLGGNTAMPAGNMAGGLPAGPASSNVSQMMQQFAAQHAAPQPNPALNNPAYNGLRQTANFAPQFNQQPAINPNDPANNAAFLLGQGGAGGSGRPYAPVLMR